MSKDVRVTVSEDGKAIGFDTETVFSKQERVGQGGVFYGMYKSEAPTLLTGDVLKDKVKNALTVAVVGRGRMHRSIPDGVGNAVIQGSSPAASLGGMVNSEEYQFAKEHEAWLKTENGQRYIKEQNDADFNVTGTVTGRMSVSSPNKSAEPKGAERVGDSNE